MESIKKIKRMSMPRSGSMRLHSLFTKQGSRNSDNYDKSSKRSSGFLQLDSFDGTTCGFVSILKLGFERL